MAGEPNLQLPRDVGIDIATGPPIMTSSGQPVSEQDKLAAQRLRELAAMLSLTSAQREKKH